jgi:hypothetical protein
MSIENDAAQRRKIREYWDQKLKQDWEEAMEQAQLRKAPIQDPWYIRFIDWFLL